MTFPVMPLRHVFCIMALMLSCSSVAVFADEGTRDPQPAITPPTAAAFSGLGGLPDVNPVSHSSSGSLPSGAAGAIPFPGVPGPFPAPGSHPVPGSIPGVTHHLDGTLGSHPGGVKSVSGALDVDESPAGVLFSPESSTVHPGPGVSYNTCGSVPPERGKGENKYCVPELPTSAPPRVGNPVQPPSSSLAPAVPGYRDASGSPSGALSSTLNAGVGGQPVAGVNSLPGNGAGMPLPNTADAPRPAPVDPNAPAAIPGFPNGYPGAAVGVTGPVHPTTPLGSHPGAGPVVSQNNGQVPGAASGPSGGKGNQAGSTVAASPPEVNTPSNNQSGGKQVANAVSVVQPSSQPPTAPAQSESTTHTPNSSNTKGSQSTTTGTTTLPPVTANSKKPNGKGDANSSRISSVWVRMPLLIVVALATGLVC